jgi:hypothetical protein
VLEHATESRPWVSELDTRQVGGLSWSWIGTLPVGAKDGCPWDRR